jgi:hypothetical protein
MTALQMRDEFLVGFDKVASFAAPGFTDEEISLFLSEAQEQFVKTRYHGKGNKYQEGFEETEKRRKDLAWVTRQTTATVSSDQTDKISTNGTLYELPENFWLTVAEWVETSDGCGHSKKIVPKTLDQFFADSPNPFKKPSKDEIWRLESTPFTDLTRHELVTDATYDVNAYKLRYIKTLTDINISSGITSELHPMVHREVVKMAVTIALENQQEPRTQSQAQMGAQVE